jgi:hypothetical protein
VADRRHIIGPCALICALLFTAAVGAQEPSYDGRRWYDVEVSIFTNEVPGGTRSELPVAHKLTAAYLPRLQELQKRSAAFLIDFPEDQLPGLLPAQPETLPEVPGVETRVRMGPVYSPAVREGFKITDFDRDAFIDLDTRAAQFASMNRSIEAAPEHRILWHKVWRQPLAGRAQTQAVFVGGGDMRAGHNELEGSLRVVDNAGGAMLDINVWLNEFSAGTVATTEEWNIPMVPFTREETTAVPETLQWTLSAVWQLAQTRELGANQLYYLDHPAIGVLIQVRPYQLPPPVGVENESDF